MQFGQDTIHAVFGPMSSMVEQHDASHVHHFRCIEGAWGQWAKGQRAERAGKRELTVRELELAGLSKPKRFVVIASSYRQTLSKPPDGRTTA